MRRKKWPKQQVFKPVSEVDYPKVFPVFSCVAHVSPDCNFILSLPLISRATVGPRTSVGIITFGRRS